MSFDIDAEAAGSDTKYLGMSSLKRSKGMELVDDATGRIFVKPRTPISRVSEPQTPRAEGMESTTDAAPGACI